MKYLVDTTKMSSFHSIEYMTHFSFLKCVIWNTYGCSVNENEIIVGLDNNLG